MPPYISSSNRSQGGKSGVGRAGTTRRHVKRLRDNIEGITKGSIRRLARRGGVRRVSADIYKYARWVIKAYLEEILRTACALVQLSKRKTIATSDVVYALKTKGKTLYGFGEGSESSLRKNADNSVKED